MTETEKSEAAAALARLRWSKTTPEERRAAMRPANRARLAQLRQQEQEERDSE